jgi:hypothetical protein
MTSLSPTAPTPAAAWEEQLERRARRRIAYLDAIGRLLDAAYPTIRMLVVVTPVVISHLT